MGQKRAGQGRSSCECAYEWFLEICMLRACGIKLATILDTWLQF